MSSWDMLLHFLAQRRKVGKVVGVHMVRADMRILEDANVGEWPIDPLCFLWKTV